MEQPNFEPKYEPFDIDEFIKTNKNNLENKEQPDIKQMLLNTVNGKRGNGFVMTYNNFTHKPDEFMALLQQLPYISRINFQIEKGQEKGTIHYQVYTHHSKQIEWGQVRRKFIKMGLHRIDIENRISSPQSADEYCSKTFQEIKDNKAIHESIIPLIDDDGKKWFQTKITPENYSWGDLPKYQQGKRTDLDNFAEIVIKGGSNQDLIDYNAKLFMLHESKASALRQAILNNKYKTVYRNPIIKYIWGKTDTGKTRYTTDKYGYENVYMIDDYKYPFDNYEQQDIIVFDDFYSQYIELPKMLRFLDGRPLKLPCRNHDKQACFTKIYFTSNSPLEKQYDGYANSSDQHKRDMYQALMRRIKNVYHFDNPEHHKKLFNDEPNPNPLYKPQPQNCEQMTIITDKKTLDNMPF